MQIDFPSVLMCMHNVTRHSSKCSFIDRDTHRNEQAHAHLKPDENEIFICRYRHLYQPIQRKHYVFSLMYYEYDSKKINKH